MRHRSTTVTAGLALLASLAFASPSTAAETGDTQPRRTACGPSAKTYTSKMTAGAARKSILCLLNAERRAHGLPGLRANRKLQRAAQRHNRLMDGTGCFAHQCPGEAPLTRRVKRTGYTRGASKWAVAENVAWGRAQESTPSQIVSAWMNSSGHRAVILTAELEEVGVGVSVGTPEDGHADGGTYTTDFGVAR